MRSLRSLVLLLAAAVSPVAAQTPAKTVPEIAPAELPAVGGRVALLRAEPTSITLRVGQTVGLDAITVTAFDSSGKVIGRLVGFDFGIPPGSAANAVPRKMTGVRAGEAELTVRFPRQHWRGRMDLRPAAKVQVVVKP